MTKLLTLYIFLPPVLPYLFCAVALCDRFCFAVDLPDHFLTTLVLTYFTLCDTMSLRYLGCIHCITQISQCQYKNHAKSHFRMNAQILYCEIGEISQGGHICSGKTT